MKGDTKNVPRIETLRKMNAMAVVLFLLASCSAGDVSGWKNAPPVDLKIGDIVFRKGTGFWSRYFINASTREKRFSHVGIVVSNSVDGIRIVHAEADDYSGIGSVRMDSWKAFYNTAVQCAVFRFNADEQSANRLAEVSTKCLGIPFDLKFDLETTNALYCTELVRNSMNEAAGREVIGYTITSHGKFVAIDDIYRDGFTRVYDSKRESKITAGKQEW